MVCYQLWSSNLISILWPDFQPIIPNSRLHSLDIALTVNGSAPMQGKASVHCTVLPETVATVVYVDVSQLHSRVDYGLTHIGKITTILREKHFHPIVLLGLLSFVVPMTQTHHQFSNRVGMGQLHKKVEFLFLTKLLCAKRVVIHIWISLMLILVFGWCEICKN